MHSDGGEQYYYNEFKSLTKELGMINSVTEEKVYENSNAERLNEIFKINYKRSKLSNKKLNVI